MRASNQWSRSRLRRTPTTASTGTCGSGGAITPSNLVNHYGELADAGAQHILFSLRDAQDLAQLELLGSDVFPQLRSL